MRGEESLFFGNCLLHWNLINNIFLRSVFDTDITKTKGHLLVANHFLGIYTSIHNVDFSDHTNRADTFGVKVTRHLQTI